MSRRIEIELTSRKDDVWTWRAAGAREPKGFVDASLLPEGSKVGDTFKVEAETFLDGIEIVAVVPTKGSRKEPERLEILGSGRDEAGVTTTLVGRRGRDRDGDGPRRGGGRRDDRRGGPRGGDGPRRDGGENTRGRGPRSDRPPRRERAERPAPPPKPKPKRLRPQRTHRSAVLADLPEAQRPIAEQVLRAGIPGVRKAIDEQNERNRAENLPQIDAAPLVALAEGLLPRLKAAEWHDRADAALAGVAEIDLRDLRSVVVAAESAARSDETRALAAELSAAVSARVESEHAQWLADIAQSLADGRTVRALRDSSRPPKAGVPLPTDLAGRLADAASASLTADTAPQRWGTVLDAVAYSPVRSSVKPHGLPPTPGDELIATVKKLSSRVPEIAALFGIEPASAPRGRSRRGAAAVKGGAKPIPPAPPRPASPATADAAVTVDPQAAVDVRTTGEPAATEEPAGTDGVDAGSGASTTPEQSTPTDAPDAAAAGTSPAAEPTVGDTGPIDAAGRPAVAEADEAAAASAAVEVDGPSEDPVDGPIPAESER